MNKREAENLIDEITMTGTWEAWPAKSSGRGIPLVWFTKRDGTTRVYHAYTMADFYAAMDKIKAEKQREEFGG